MGHKTPQEIWEAALGELQLQVSRPNYRTWFEKTRGLSYNNNIFTISVPNSFVAEYLERNQHSLIEKALARLTSSDVRVAFEIGNAAFSSNPVSPGSTAFPLPRLNPGYSFETFIEGTNNRLARSAALAVAANPGHSYNPLFIHGGAGLGKTHLLHAIGHIAVAKSIPLICVSAENFTNEFVSSIREKRSEEFRSKYRGAEMLLVDDVQFIGGKEQTEETFFHTFNELHLSNRQIVVTCDRPPRAMPGIEEKLRSRFEWGLTVDIEPPDYDTRLAILLSKAEQREVSLYPAVMELIASQPKSNVRELEGSLNRVIAYARLLHTNPDVATASKALEDIGSKEPAKTDGKSRLLLERVAESFQMSPEDLTGRARSKEVVLARRVAMYFLRRETGSSLAQIGQELGGRDAAAVTNACKSIASEMDNNSYLKSKLSEIDKKLRASSR